MLNRLRLQDVGPASRMEISFAPRLTLLTGDNGLGKTFVLDIVWWALTQTWAGLPAWPQRGKNVKPVISIDSLPPFPFMSRYDYATQSWETEPPSPSLSRPQVVVYVRVDGGFSVWDSARNGLRLSGAKIDEAVRSAGYHFAPMALWDGLTEGGKILCSGLIRDWVLWQLQGTEAFAQLEDVLKILSPNTQETLQPGPPIRVSLDDARDIPTLEMPYGTVPVIYASAGMKRIVALAYLLVWAWQEHQHAARLLNQAAADHVTILIDEVEAHLHPCWQRVILPALLAVVSRLQGTVTMQIIATTHAPLVLASVEPDFDEDRDRVLTFELHDRQVVVREIPWAKQGDVVGWLTSEAFGLQQARSLEAERAIEAAEAFMRGDQHTLPHDLRTRDAIDAELRRVLAGHDLFWPRWIVHGEAAHT